MGSGRRMDPEAKARGKAQGYAHGVPEESMVESSTTSKSSGSTRATEGYDWQDLPWSKIERKVHKLQRRIYQASQRGDTKKVHHLQRLLLHSWSARCLATRKVTQDNHGKK